MSRTCNSPGEVAVKRAIDSFTNERLPSSLTRSSTTANQIGLDPVLTASVNSAAGVMGKMIALPSIAVAVAATGLTPEDDGKLFRFSLSHKILLACVVGIVAILFADVFPAMVPVLPPK